MPRDYYEILGVQKTADQDTIKKAYRKLAMQFHPDKNPGDKEAEEKFKEASGAYAVLGDVEKRATYDRFGHDAFTRQGSGGFRNNDDIFNAFSDIFSDFFGFQEGQGRGRRARGPRRGSDLRYLCEISLKEVVSGIEKDLEFESEDSCSECNGAGVERGHQAETCPRCKGSGQFITSQGFFQVATTCPTCEGAGQVIRHPCPSCSGKGRKPSKRKLRVTIPAGVETGTRLRVAGEGEGGYKGGERGDLYVEMRVMEDRRFVRRGQNLLSKVRISYLKAVLGGDITVDTLEGEKSLHIPKGTNPGELVKLEGMGLPHIRSSARGDIVYEIHIEIPKKLKKEEEKLLREIADLRGEEVSKSKGIFGF